jgi:hypothetical protein
MFHLRVFRIQARSFLVKGLSYTNSIPDFRYFNLDFSTYFEVEATIFTG